MMKSTKPLSRRRGRSLYTPIASFSIACFILACLTDFVYWGTASILWETMSVWLLAVGLIVGSLAILAGFVDLFRSRRVAGLGQSWLIVLGQTIAFCLSVVNVLVHSRDGYTAVVPLGLTLSSLTVLSILVTSALDRARPVARLSEV